MGVVPYEPFKHTKLSKEKSQTQMAGNEAQKAREAIHALLGW